MYQRLATLAPLRRLPPSHVSHISRMARMCQGKSISYHVAGSWLSWELSEMVQDPVLPKLYFLEVGQHTTDCYRYVDGELEYGCEFQVVQNANWSCVLHPLDEKAEVPSEVSGPDAEGHELVREQHRNRSFSH